MALVSQNPQEEASALRSSQRDCHFTYCDPDCEDLRQGDMLEKTSRLGEVLRAANPYCTREEDYRHFVILTQSCDLVRRNGKCKAKYISLAAIRPLQLVVERELAKCQRDEEWKIAAVCSEDHKYYIKQFVERILNNNEPEYFYFEPDEKYDLYEQSCAFLRLSTAVRAREHYESLLEARILSLEEIFRAKLGWLVGNIYARIGTQDWVPETYTEDQFKEKINRIVNEVTLWIPEVKLSEAKKSISAVPRDKESILAHIKATTVPSRKEQVIEAVLGVLEKDEVIQAKDKKNIRNRLTNNQELSNLLR